MLTTVSVVEHAGVVDAGRGGDVRRPLLRWLFRVRGGKLHAGMCQTETTIPIQEASVANGCRRIDRPGDCHSYSHVRLNLRSSG
jgi:hypothetical protein